MSQHAFSTMNAPFDQLACPGLRLCQRGIENGSNGRRMAMMGDRVAILNADSQESGSPRAILDADSQKSDSPHNEADARQGQLVVQYKEPDQAGHSTTRPLDA
eukprot:12409096-Karenia_brevis.AAC.1